ncbi:DMT family transporter [Rhodovastum atsumiense]|uniref:DMT family transporter n=1 Tax=Rhodovastum atsumiense TaxID=504468 RepID=A0A5M6ITN9_9PROT|nr:DMT family transporter [Rhodovastum atsumiense]KAA5611674.1 DMT family transporter [Rhodovastum atsumiense]CAH2604247.1 DMT family transporter [Rhodovastum atsumiense]
MDRSPPPRHDRLDAFAVGVITLLCALWGLQQVAVKVAITGGLPPLLQGGIRHVVAAALVWMFVRARGGAGAARRLWSIDSAIGPGLVIAALFALEFIALLPGLKLTTASHGVLFLYTAPFFTALGVHVFLPAERLDRRQATGLAIAFTGVVAAFADGLTAGGGNLVGDLLCLAAGAAWGATTVVVKASPSLMRAAPERVLFLQLAGSVPLMAAASLLAGERLDWQATTPLAWTGLFYQTAVVAFASYLAWFRLVQVYPAGRLAGFTFLTPLFGILAGATLLGEHASLALLAGLIAIAVGLRLINSKGRPT